VVQQRKTFRRLLAEPGILVQPAIYDPLGARLAEDAGIKCIGLGGYAMGAHLAVTEPLVSLDEAARITRQVSAVSKLPIMVDAGAGWGEPLHVMHTLRTLEAAGAASLHIEDQHYPKRVSYHRGVEEVIPIEEMTAKVRACVAARTDSDFVIVARTDAMRTHGYDEGISRARACLEAGADAILLFPNDEEETIRAPKDLPGVPLVYVNSTGNRFGRGVFPAPQLEAWGWKIVFDAISAVNVTAAAMRSYLETLARTGESGLRHDEVVEVRKAVEKSIGLEDLYKLERETVPGVK
jgi:methylisocitrate lyase